MDLTFEEVRTLIGYQYDPLFTASGITILEVGSVFMAVNQAIRAVDGTVTHATTVTDADLTAIDATLEGEFLDFVLYFVLEKILGHLDDVDVTAGPRSEKFSQLALQVERKIERLRKELERNYGYGLAYAGLEAGVITNKFAEHD